MSYEKTVLDNGLVLLTMPLPYVRSVSTCVFLAAGSRYEGEHEAGVSHFIEHVVFKGGQRWPTARAISEAVEGVGGFINASTGRETTMYWNKVAQPFTRLAMEVLADLLVSPSLTPSEIEKERQVVIEEINMLRDSPESLVQILTTDLVWKGHTLAREISGTKESVTGMTRDSVTNYMARRYGPGTTVVSIAGAIDASEVKDIVAECFGSWRPAPGGRPEAYVDEQQGSRSNVMYKDTEQAHMCMAFPSIPRNHPSRFALTLANTVLGDGMSSRLFQEIRERHALAYSVDSFVSFLQDTGMLGVYAGVDPSRADRTLGAISDELRRIRDELVTEDELRRAIEFNKGRLLLQMENTSAVAAWYGRQEVLPGEVYTVDEVVRLLEGTTREDVRRAMQDVLLSEKLNLAVVGPFKEPDVFAGRLAL